MICLRSVCSIVGKYPSTYVGGCIYCLVKDVLPITSALFDAKRDGCLARRKEQHTNTRCTKDDDLSLHLFRRHSFNLSVSLGLVHDKVESGSEEDSPHFIDYNFVLNFVSVLVVIFVFVFIFGDGLEWFWLRIDANEDPIRELIDRLFDVRGYTKLCSCSSLHSVSYDLDVLIVDHLSHRAAHCDDVDVV